MKMTLPKTSTAPAPLASGPGSAAGALRRNRRDRPEARNAYARALAAFRESLVRVSEETNGLTAQAEDAGSFAEVIDGFARRFYPDAEDRLAFLRKMRFRSEQERNLNAGPAGLESGELFQPDAEEIRLADEALRRDALAWAKMVDRAEELKGSRMVPMLRQTPLVLQMLGAENRRLQATYHLLKDGLGKHGLPEETIKQIPEAMADPVMVFKSATQGGDLVMMLELKDLTGATIVVPVALEQTSPSGYTINLATSVYGKGNIETLKPNNRWFTHQIERGNLLYRNNKKSRDWARTVGLQLPAADSRLSTSARHILFTESDLVKLREANPTMYQTAYHGTAYRFDKFSLEHIGSGEGAQSYGWGLYFAGDKEVAEWYRESLAIRKSLVPDMFLPDGGKISFSDPTLAEKLDGLMRRAGIDKRYSLDVPFPLRSLGHIIRSAFSGARSLDAVGNSLSRSAEYSEQTGKIDTARAYATAFNVLRELRNRGLKEAESGRIYEVDIPESAELLDWDESIYGSPYFELIQADVNAFAKAGGATTGSGFYRYLSGKLGSDRAASEYLNSLGIKGIRYLDGTSRSQGEGSHNYVIFDDTAIDVIRTYYQQKVAHARGSIKMYPQGCLISLFRNADLSTIVHESAHLFKEEMDGLRRSSLADEAMLRDMRVLDEWLARFDDDTILEAEYEKNIRTAPGMQGKAFSGLSDAEMAHMRETAKHEYFARGFEAYMREGKSPAEKLVSVFTRFKNWLLAIYKDAAQLDVELADEVRGVFDRMIVPGPLLPPESMETAPEERGSDENKPAPRTGEEAKAFSGVVEQDDEKDSPSP